MTAIIVIAILIIVAGMGVALLYNGLVQRKNTVEEAFSTMDVYLKKRYDLIPNIVETVKGYAKHEKETLEQIIAARNTAAGASSQEEKMKSESILSGRIGGLMALAESYPELKANTNFLELQNQLKKVEEDIANARKYYNAAVKNYNNQIMMFPSSIVAGMFHFEKQPMFEITNEAERENVKVSF